MRLYGASRSCSQNGSRWRRPGATNALRKALEELREQEFAHQDEGEPGAGADAPAAPRPAPPKAPPKPHPGRAPLPTRAIRPWRTLRGSDDTCLDPADLQAPTRRARSRRARLTGSGNGEVGDAAGAGQADDTWSHTFDLVCDETTSIGPQEWIDDPQRSLVWSGVTLSAPAGWYSFDLTASAEAYITIQACDNPEVVYVWTDEPQTDAYLPGAATSSRQSRTSTRAPLRRSPCARGAGRRTPVQSGSSRRVPACGGR